MSELEIITGGITKAWQDHGDFLTTITVVVSNYGKDWKCVEVQLRMDLNFNDDDSDVKAIEDLYRNSGLSGDEFSRIGREVLGLIHSWKWENRVELQDEISGRYRQFNEWLSSNPQSTHNI